MVQYKEKEGIVNDGSKSKGKDHWYTLDEWCAPPPPRTNKKKGGKSPPKGGPKTGRNRPRIRSVSLLLCTPLQNLPPKMPVGMSWNLILALTAISAITPCCIRERSLAWTFARVWTARADPWRLFYLIMGDHSLVVKAIEAVCTVKIYIAKLTAQSPHLSEATMELGTHADNTVLGDSCLLIRRCLGFFNRPRVD